MSDGLAIALCLLMGWQAGGATVGLMMLLEDGVPLMQGAFAWTPVGIPICLLVALVCWPENRRRVREARVEADYRETLRLIEWTPRPVSPLDEVRDALEVEQLLAPEGNE